MKKLFFMMMLVGVSIAYAQAETATLQQGETMNAFYGSNAFKEAYAAAKSGAVITLSEGYFNPVDSITKSVTIIGSGYVGTPTKLGFLNLATPIVDNGNNKEFKEASLIINADNVKIDGIKIDYPLILRSISGLHISHCYIECILNTGTTNTGTIIDQCYIKQGWPCVTDYKFTDGCIKNSFVDRMGISGFTYLNSLLYRILYWGIDDIFSVNGNKCVNCIIGYHFGKYKQGGEGCYWGEYSLYISNRYDCYSNSVLFLYPYSWNGSELVKVDYLASHLPCNADEISLYVDNTTSTWEDLFNEDVSWYDPAYIKTTALGDDGTVVGPYGGTGFSLYPSIPRITESKIDTYTNGEGKLNVKVKVEVGQ